MVLNRQTPPYARLIANWLTRVSKETSVQEVPEAATVLGTTVGEVRKDNQDRTSVVRFVPHVGDKRGFVLAALCDGMGGMKGGAECAALAIGTTVEMCLRSPGVPPAQRLRAAIEAANRAVYDAFRGEGGTTIAAILATELGVAMATVGDTRIYSFEAQQRKLTQLSQDDTIAAELRRLRGNTIDRNLEPFSYRLAQFVGIGSDLEVRLYDSREMPADTTLILSSDGAHSIPQPVLEMIFRSAPNPQQSVWRVLQITRWCGGQDNASMVYTTLSALRNWPNAADSMVPRLEIWDAFGNLSIAIPESVPVLPAVMDRGGSPELPHTVRPKQMLTRRKSTIKSGRQSSKASREKQPSSFRAVDGQRRLQIEISGDPEIAYDKPVLLASRARLECKQHTDGWNLTLKNEGSRLLSNVRLVLVGWQQYSDVDNNYADDSMKQELLEQSLGGKKPASNNPSLIRYDAQRTVLVIPGDIRVVEGGIFRARIEVSADGYAPRFDEFFFAWKPGANALLTGDPTRTRGFYFPGAP
jgi:serine/threonine protein phosphatase PrpC